MSLLGMSLEVVFAGVALTADFAGKSELMRPLVTPQIVLASEGLKARGGLLASFDLVRHTLGRTRQSGNTGMGGSGNACP
jgi:hypothetical protein